MWRNYLVGGDTYAAAWAAANSREIVNWLTVIGHPSSDAERATGSCHGSGWETVAHRASLGFPVTSHSTADRLRSLVPMPPEPVTVEPDPPSAAATRPPLPGYGDRVPWSGDAAGVAPYARGTLVLSSGMWAFTRAGPQAYAFSRPGHDSPVLVRLSANIGAVFVRDGVIHARLRDVYDETLACAGCSAAATAQEGDTFVCDSCLRRRGQCAHPGCGGHAYPAGAHAVPPTCFEHRGGTAWCERCGAWVERHSHCSCGAMRDDSLVCPSCGRGTVLPYSDRRANAMGPFGPGPVRYGVEVEVEVSGRGIAMSAGRLLSALGSDFAIAKSDSSLDNGYELVTAPADLATHTERWSRALVPNVTRSTCCGAKDTCGMHVHVSREPLSCLQVGKILVLVNDPSNHALVTGVAERGSNTYSRIHPKKIRDAVRADPNGRYSAVNLTNNHTIEFRIFKSSLQRDKVLRNLEFVDAVVDYTTTGVASVSAMTARAFCGHVMKQARRWPTLSAWLAAEGFLAHYGVPHRKAVDKPLPAVVDDNDEADEADEADDDNPYSEEY